MIWLDNIMKRYKIVDETTAASMLKETFADCTLGSYVGSGAQASVYRCKTADGREEVLKCIDIKKAALLSAGHEDAEQEEAMRMGAETEIDLLKLLAGRNHAVQLIGEAHDHERRFYVLRMQMLTPLNDYLKIARKQTSMAKLAARIAFDVALGLQDMVNIGFVHRDVKPENICALVQEDHVSFMLCDFGSSSPIGEIPTFGSKTPDYAPPEAESLQKPTDRYDVYSLGVLMENLLKDEPCPETLSKLVRACKARLPEDRPSLQQICKVLGNYLLHSKAGKAAEAARAPRSGGKNKNLRTMGDALRLLTAKPDEETKCKVLDFADTLDEGRRSFLHALLAESPSGQIFALRDAAASGYTLAEHYYGLALLQQAQLATDRRLAEKLRRAGMEWLEVAAKNKYYPAKVILDKIRCGKEPPADYENVKIIAFSAAL